MAHERDTNERSASHRGCWGAPSGLVGTAGVSAADTVRSYWDRRRLAGSVALMRTKGATAPGWPATAESRIV
jgi:hypothetical protein